MFMFKYLKFYDLIKASVGNKKSGGIYFSTNLKVMIHENYG